MLIEFKDKTNISLTDVIECYHETNALLVKTKLGKYRFYDDGIKYAMLNNEDLKNTKNQQLRIYE